MGGNLVADGSSRLSDAFDNAGGEAAGAAAGYDGEEAILEAGASGVDHEDEDPVVGSPPRDQRRGGGRQARRGWWGLLHPAGAGRRRWWRCCPVSGPCCSLSLPWARPQSEAENPAGVPLLSAFGVRRREPYRSPRLIVIFQPFLTGGRG